MSKVIVTGANGFVGNHLVLELAQAGYEVIGVGGPRVPGMKDPEGLTHYIVADLNNPEEVSQIDFTGVTGLIHLAGMAAVGPSFDDPLTYVSVNVGLQVHLFEEAAKQGAKPKFVVISSGALYDPNASLPLTEESHVLPSSPYAVSKIGQEQMGLYYHLRGFEVVIARPFNHIGPGQNLGFIVPDLTKQVIDVERGETDRVLAGNMDAKRDYTDVRDIARAYRLMLEHGRTGETYNICSGTSYSGQEMLDLILTAADSHAVVENDPTRMRPSDTPDIYGSHEKLTADTGWQPEIPLEVTLADVVADWRSRD
ncbi:GDP-mannose 4,6-dehydratase [Candidatus Saccharibacteria bacterium]|nr:MAG: GDP-mannose 4,6-dehydratase [Candidatus Saccharibacteria bacterium]